MHGHGWKLIYMYVIRFVYLFVMFVSPYLGRGGWFVAIIIDQGIISLQTSRVVTQLGSGDI